MTLKEARERIGLSQKQLAKLSGVHVSLIPKLETQGRPIGNIAARNYIALCDVLGVDPHSLLENEKNDGRGGNMM